MALQVLQRTSRVGECRPVLHRLAIRQTLAPGDRDAPFLGQAAVDDQKKVAIVLRRRLQLLRGLVTGMGLEDLVAGQRLRQLAGERLEPLDHSRFPVDERAVAVECQGLEVSQFHERSSFILKGGVEGLVEPLGETVDLGLGNAQRWSKADGIIREAAEDEI